MDGHCTPEVRALLRRHLGGPGRPAGRDFETWRLGPGAVLWAPLTREGDGPSRLYVTLDDGQPFMHLEVRQPEHVGLVLSILRELCPGSSA
jgi:hypothetical protein